MSRGMLAWMLLLIAGTAAGCRMCASPYDHCRPTFTGQCGEECAPMVRAGSVLSGYFPPMPDDQYLPDLPEVPSVEIMPPGVGRAAVDRAGVTDGESTAEGDSVVDGGPEGLPSEPGPDAESERASRSQGWTAVRPIDTRLD